MEYLMKGGVLYRGETEPVGKIRGWLCGNRHTISQGTDEYQVWAQPLEQPEERCSGREYCLRGKGGATADAGGALLSPGGRNRSRQAGH